MAGYSMEMEKENHEPRLSSIVYWDRNNNGEHNKTNEPSIRSDTKGYFAFEWISELS